MSAKLEPGMSMSPDAMVIKGKPADVRRMLEDLVATHGEDATLPEVYQNTMKALLHPVVPATAPVAKD